MAPHDPTGDEPSQGYPGQGYPGQGYPNEGYPTEAYPGPAYPDEGYPNEGYPNQPTQAHPPVLPTQVMPPVPPAQPPASAPGQPPAGPPGMTGEPLGSEYMMFDLIGRGAMGQVHRARTRSGELVAVKLLRQDLASDPGLVSRFLQERTILTSLQHNNVVRVRDLVAEGGKLAIVMDLVNGTDLRKELARSGTLPAADAVSVIINVLHGLGAVHAANVIHRDLKPENVLIDTNVQTGTRTPKITDFGISSLAQTTQGSYRTGAIGTPEYMAPELIGDGAPSTASDIYAVGIMLYELLCGVTPFHAGSALALMHKHVNQLPGRPAGIPDQLWSLTSHLLAKDPQARPGNALQVAGWLQGMLPQLTALPALPKLTEPPPPDADAQTIQSPLTRPAPEPPPPAAPGRGRRTALIAAGLVILLAIIGVGAYLILKPGDDAVTPPITPTPSPSTTVSPSASPTSESPSPSPSVSPTEPIPEEATPSPGVDTSQTLPDFVGQQLADVVGELAKRGLGYTTTITYDADKPNNLVTAQSPGKGEPAGSRVELTVSRTAVPTYLSDLGALGDSPDAGPADIGSKTYPHALSANICDPQSERTWEYNLSERYQTLSGVAGLVDTSSRAERATVEIYVGDNKVFNKSVSLSSPAKFNVDVAGVQRLRIVVTDTKCVYDGLESYFAMGDPVLLAPPTGLS